MNKEKISEMISPHVKNNQLTYDEFNEIFYMLTPDEKYLISNFLTDELKIILVDEKDFSTREDFQFVDDVLSTYLENNQLTYGESDEDFSDVESWDEIISRKDYEIKASNTVLLRLAKNGDKQALQDFFVKNRRLVLKCAANYNKKYNHRLDFADLEQAGMIGMLKAVEKFDLSQGTQFSTYAVWWINQSISRMICDEGFTIRLPVYTFDKVHKARALDSKFYLQGKSFSERVELIANEMKISTDEVHELFKLRYEYLNFSSLEAPANEESDTELKDFVEDKVTPSTFDAVAEKILREKIISVLDTLTEREKQVLMLRYGFYDGKERTLEEIGKNFKLTRERIRQIEAKALKKLRHPVRSKILKEFLD